MNICICKANFIIIKIGDKVNAEEYKKIVKEMSPKENRLKNIMVAFFIGGLIGFIGEFIIYFLMESFGMAKTDAYIWLCLSIILFGVLLTSFGFFDNWFNKCKCGLIIPTTGFAHSVASCALDYKKEGLITGIGANLFKLAGSVIVYGVLSAFLLTIVKVLLGG